jgi:ribonuclease R
MTQPEQEYSEEPTPEADGDGPPDERPEVPDDGDSDAGGSDLWPRARAILKDHTGQGMTVKALARRLNLDSDGLVELRRAARRWIKSGRMEVSGAKLLSLPTRGSGAKAPKKLLDRPGAEKESAKLVRGVFKRHHRGFGFVRPMDKLGSGTKAFDLFVPPDETGDAATGDEVLVKRVPSRKFGRTAGPGKESTEARIVKILKRSAGQFVGTYYAERGKSWVRIDGSQFAEPLELGDPGAKRVREGDKIAVEITRYPTVDRRGAAVIVAVLGRHGEPGVETQMILHAYELNPEFPELVQAEARAQARLFEAMLADGKFPNRKNFRDELTVTIDPVNARDFDDAISLHRYENGHWRLMVHVADVSAFVESGSALDDEARRRGNSVYLPDLVVPMLPEVISNSLASLQTGEPRLSVTVEIHFTPEGIVTGSEVHRSVILVDHRFTYEQAYQVMMTPPETPLDGQDVREEIRRLIERMHKLAMILRERRFRRGALELNLPEIALSLDDDGHAKTAQLVSHDESHQVIEEFMLAANEAVAGRIGKSETPFIRRAHPDPEPLKLRELATFAEEVGYHVADPENRFELQRLLKETAGRPEEHAIHYALLRSLKQARYTPEEIGHYALASKDYCHFTSPIRRYPDLVSHRQVLDLIRGKRPFSDFDELYAIGEDCTKSERKAAAAERELVKLKILLYLQDHVGEVFEAVITGVEDYGFYAQLVLWPIDGLVRLERLGADSLWYFEEASRSLVAKRGGKRYRLGDRVRLRIVDVDVEGRDLHMAPAEFPWNDSMIVARTRFPVQGGRPGPRKAVEGGEDSSKRRRVTDARGKPVVPRRGPSQGRIRAAKKSRKRR